MKIQSKTIILLLLLIVSLISLLSYFFFTKYKFLLDYIDNRIDLKHNKLVEKYNLNNLYENNKQNEQKYFANLKDNLENFNNTLSQTNFIDQITELSDIEEEDEEEIYSEEDIENILIPTNEPYMESTDEPTIECDGNVCKIVKKEPIEDIKEIEIKQGEIQNIVLDDELPNLDNLDDNVDDYIKQILESKDEEIDLSLMEEETEKKKIT
jgi:LPS O-antigen subunit length determinant protein (WzzB/FepE family)